MFKFLAVTFLVAFVNAEWQKGIPDVRCPRQETKNPVYLPGPNCGSFFECSYGMRFPFECLHGLHFNMEKSVCDYPQEAKCEVAENFMNVVEESAEADENHDEPEEPKEPEVVEDPEEPEIVEKAEEVVAEQMEAVEENEENSEE